MSRRNHRRAIRHFFRHQLGYYRRFHQRLPAVFAAGYGPVTPIEALWMDWGYWTARWARKGLIPEGLWTPDRDPS